MKTARPQQHHARGVVAAAMLMTLLCSLPSPTTAFLSPLTTKTQRTRHQHQKQPTVTPLYQRINSSSSSSSTSKSSRKTTKKSVKGSKRKRKNVGRKRKKRSPTSLSFASALALVPNQDDWDRLQRARYVARDPVFHAWPPCMRLFHPFPLVSFSSSTGDETSPTNENNDIALEVAAAVEALKLEGPLRIEFENDWVIVPHMEQVEEAWMSADGLPTDGHSYDESGKDNLEQHALQYSEEELKTRRLIAAEERTGKARLKQRKANQAQKQQAKEKATSFSQTEEPPQEKEESVPKVQLQVTEADQTSEDMTPTEEEEAYYDQQRQLDDFGGPCVLCLEPTMESKEGLIALRELLAEQLGMGTYFSPSSLYSWSKVGPSFDLGFRPLIPISRFDSTASAMEVAKHVKTVWEYERTSKGPLIMEISDLQLISCHDPEEGEDDDTTTTIHDYYDIANSLDWNKEAWACNAKVNLIGQEEDTIEPEMMASQLERLTKEGSPGGGGNPEEGDTEPYSEREEAIHDNDMIHSNKDNKDVGTSLRIEQWLNEIDDDGEMWNEGTEVVMGRTHFYTGQKRTYVGMPASSTMDQQDRHLGHNNATSRRRRTPIRAKGLWEDGEYGHRSNVKQPGRRRKKSSKAERLLDEDE